jgi:hypothetical protein
VPIPAGSSLKAALDLDWDDPGARDQALGLVLAAVAQLEAVVADQGLAQAPGVAAGLAAAGQIRDQDVTTTATGRPTLRHGVARDRRISIEDAEMRHGRKTRSLRIDGYKCHVLNDLDTC